MYFLRNLTIVGIISVMLLASDLLYVFNKNFIVLGNFRYLWAPIFIVFVVLYHNKALTLNSVKYALIFGLLYGLILQNTLWRFSDDWYSRKIYYDIYDMIVIVLFFSMLFQKNNPVFWNHLSRLGLLFIVISGITTIIATHIYPGAVRASYSSLRIDDELYYSSVKHLGIGSYGYMTAIVALFPTLIYFYKKGNIDWLNRRRAIVLTVFLFIVLLYAQIFANIIVALIILLMAYFGEANFKRNIFVIGLIIIISLIIPKYFWTNSLLNISDYFPSDSNIHYKFVELADYTFTGERFDRANPIGGRAERYPMLFEAFKASPFFGDASYYSKYDTEMGHGGHLYWMSCLALWGVFGFLGYLLILYKIFTPVFNLFDKEFRFYYLLSTLAIIMLGFMKALNTTEIYFILLIIIPGLYMGVRNKDLLLKTNKEKLPILTTAKP